MDERVTNEYRKNMVGSDTENPEARSGVKYISQVLMMKLARRIFPKIDSKCQ